MRKRSWAVLLVFLLMISSVMYGCSSSNSDDGKTLIFGRGGDSVALDPGTVTDGESFKVTENIFETLLDFGKQNTELVPMLATKWKMSDDGLTYTLTLRDDVKFQDGTDFNADAVVKNFDRWMHGTADQFPYYGSQFGGYFGDAGHVIEQVKSIDEHTVEFTLKRPQATFLKNIAMSPFAIVSPKAIDELGEKLGENPKDAGTGPFKFVEWKRNDKIVLKKNEDYWAKDEPKLSQLIFKSIPENSARLNALISGEIDLADGINPTDVGKIESTDGLQLIERPSMNVGYLGLTANREPFGNPKVRQAMNYAINRQALVDAFYAGKAEVASNPMPPILAGFNKDIQPYEYNPEKAKELLAEAGLEEGFEMELWAMPVPRDYMPDGQKIAEAIQSDLAKVGIKAKIVSYEWATYLDKASKGEADAFLLGWTGDNGDADNFLYALLDKDSIGSNNYSYYANNELHDILIEAQTEVDQEKRNELYKKAQEIIHEDAPWVPLVYSTPLLAGKKSIENYFPHPTGTDKFNLVDIKE